MNVTLTYKRYNITGDYGPGSKVVRMSVTPQRSNNKGESREVRVRIGGGRERRGENEKIKKRKGEKRETIERRL